MFNFLTNIIAFFIFIISILTEFIISLFLDIDRNFLFLITTAVYSIFIIYQIIITLYYYYELNKAKEIINEIINSIKGIPIVNKDERIIIKWDLIFKDLTDNKNYNLYDKIVRFRTKKLNQYINQHPSILFDNTFMKEYAYNKSLKSFVSKEDADKEKNSKFNIDENIEKKIFINDITNQKVTFTNYNSSIIIDMILVNEYEPSDYKKLNVEPNPLYDGFSVNMYYNKKKYTVIPRIVFYGKKIDKSKWFFDNIGLFYEIANSFIEGDKELKYELNERILSNYIEKIPKGFYSYKPTILFHSLVKKSLVFKNIDFDKDPATINCNIENDSNSFEVILETLEKGDEDEKEIIEFNKTVAVGTSYEPILVVFENLPQIIKNIELVISGKDIDNIVF
ncbi:MAG: hypothetical protein M0P77_04460 [Firmicutes bacterium]|nr:hypothetical protein [Bacillota bacterium]